MKSLRSLLWIVAAFTLVHAPLPAQESTRAVDLVQLTPQDFGMVAVARDLRANLERWGQSPWLAKLHRSPIGAFLQQGQELADLKKLHDDFKNHLGVDWATLRDDVFGDLVVFGYRPGPQNKPDLEEALFLVRPRRPEALTTLVDKINHWQKKSGELKSLDSLEHRGVKYLRRTGAKETHYYFQDGGVFALTSHEATLKEVIERFKEPSGKTASTWSRWLGQAGADKAFLALAVNPRPFDPEFQTKSPAAGKPEENPKLLADAWQALDCLVLGVRLDNSLEFKLSVQARIKDLPEAYRRLFADAGKPSLLWQYFPERPIVALAGQVNVTEFMNGLAQLLPPPARKSLLDQKRNIGALIGLDLPGDVYPNVGPDWGLCLFPAADPKHMPQLLAALAVRPGAKEAPVDQSLVKGLQFLVGLALFEYNRTHENPIRLLTLKQGEVEVKYLTADKLFPAGFQPAFALKDGYLVLGSSPAAIAQFKKNEAAPAAGAEIPVFRLSASELAKLLRHQRPHLVDQIAQRNNIDPDLASQGLDGVINVLDLFDRFEWTQAAAGNQFSAMWRFYP
jgi:hypothetical protein